jgi:ribosomal protein L31
LAKGSSPFSPVLFQIKMKRMTHPQLAQTLVQWKDGSLYTKSWLYFRPNLPVEVETESHPIWKRAAESLRLNLKPLKEKKNANN